MPRLFAASLELSPGAGDGALAAPSALNLLPPSGFSGRDGRGPFYYDWAALAAAFKDRGLKLAIDLEHASLDAGKTGAVAPAVGWITALSFDGNGVWGQVEWTDQGRSLIESGGFKYLSPVFSASGEKSGRIVELIGAGLTHTPNLFLKPVAQKETTMDPELESLLVSLRAFFGLPEDAAIDAILAALTAEAEKDDAKTAEAPPADDLAAMRAELMAIKADLAAAEASRHADQCAAAVDAAIGDGKITPAQRPHYLKMAEADLKAFSALVKTLQPFAGFKPSAHKNAPPDAKKASPFDLALKRV